MSLKHISTFLPPALQQMLEKAQAEGRVTTHHAQTPAERERRSGKQFRPHRPAPAMRVKR